MTTPPPDNTEIYIGFGLFVLSELVGMSKLRSNSILQVVLHMARELFPYTLERREPPSRFNRPQLPWGRRRR